MPNAMQASVMICGDPIASEDSAVRKRDRESKHLAATTREQRNFQVVAADSTDWQRGSGKELRKNFINTGISEPFD
jgi:hypothetical protein